MAALLVWLWAGFAFSFFGGYFHLPLYRGLFALTAVSLLFTQARALPFIEALRRLPRWGAIGILGLAFTLGNVAPILDFEGLNGTLYDLTQFIQATYSHATRGVPDFFFHGTVTSYHHVHRSVFSLNAVSLLYGLTGHPWVILIWEGVGLLFPGVIAIFGYRAVMRKHGMRPEPLGDLLAFLCYFCLPTVQAQTLWPSTFHVAGFSFLALAYLFYYERRWALWFASLILLLCEKEEWGFIGSTFGGVVCLESLLVWRKAPKKPIFPLVLGGLIGMIGVWTYFHYAAHSAQVVQFSNRFGHWGESPGEAIQVMLREPWRIIEDLLRRDSFVYLRFILIASLIWLFPRWTVIRFLIPVSPLIFLYLIADEGPMQMLKDHYSLPVSVGLSATYLFGIWDRILTRENERGSMEPSASSKAYAALFLVAFLPLAWNHQSASEAYRLSLKRWAERKQERALLSDLRKDKEVVVCCEDRLCAMLSDRPYLFAAEVCLKGAPALEPARGKPTVYLLYRDTKLPPQEGAVPLPDQWIETPFLRMGKSREGGSSPD